jgi:hypothetical protein
VSACSYADVNVYFSFSVKVWTDTILVGNDAFVPSDYHGSNSLIISENELMCFCYD